MAFKDHNCTCDEYCRCSHGRPCACEKMGQDPHCEICLNHLSPGQERAWREFMAAHGIDVEKWEEQWDEAPAYLAKQLSSSS
jgi:hypothetical protein